MLDYAANGVAHWRIEQIIDAFNATVAKAGGEPEQRLRQFLQEQEPKILWRKVHSDLGWQDPHGLCGRPNSQGTSTHRGVFERADEACKVLAIEVAQFMAGGTRLLAPKLIGATERAAAAKAVTPIKPPIDEEGWLETLREQKGEEAARNAVKLLSWFKERGFITSVTNSQDAVSARPDHMNIWPFFIRRSTGKIDTALQFLKNDPAFASEEARLNLLAKLKALPGMTNINKSTGWPSMPLEALSEDAVWAGFTAIAEQVQGLIKRGLTASDSSRINPSPPGPGTSPRMVGARARQRASFTELVEQNSSERAGLQRARREGAPRGIFGLDEQGRRDADEVAQTEGVTSAIARRLARTPAPKVHWSV